MGIHAEGEDRLVLPLVVASTTPLETTRQSLQIMAAAV